MISGWVKGRVGSYRLSMGAIQIEQGPKIFACKHTWRCNRHLNRIFESENNLYLYHNLVDYGMEIVCRAVVIINKQFT